MSTRGDGIDAATQDLAQRALQKRRLKQRPTREEERALRRVTKAAEEKQRWEFYASIPKKHYRSMSGRQTKTLNEQAELHGIPIGGDTIDLTALVRWIHDFLATHKHRLSTAIDDPLLEGASETLRDAYIRQQILEKREKAKLARLDRLEREKGLRDAKAIAELLGQLAAIRRAKNDAIQRLYGDGPVKLNNESLEDEKRTIDKFFDTEHDREPDHESDA